MIRGLLSAGAALMLGLAVSPASRAADDVAVVVLPLISDQVEHKVAEGVTALIEDEIAALDGFRVLPVNARVKALLKKCRHQEPACLARAADKRGADLALFGRMNRSNDGLELHLRLLDVARASERREVLEPLRGGDDGLRAGVHRAVLGTLTPERLTGSLRVTCNVDGARVRVDGRTLGSTPLTSALDGIREGTRTVTVDRVGYEPYEQVVEVRFAQESTVQAALLRRTDVSAEEIQELEKAELPPGPWRPGLGPWSWVITGAGGALVIAGIASGVMVLLQSAEVERRASGQVLVFPRDQQLVEQGRLFSVLANVLYGAGLVTTAAGTTLGLWDILVPGAEPAPAPGPPQPAVEVEEWDNTVTAPPENRSEPETEQPPSLAPPEDLEPPPAAGGPELPDGDALPEGDL
ncbi:MAG: PEGA domain-containing protein [Pseudomonadota bacterium]